MRNRILLFGDTGQVGFEIVKQFDDFETNARLHIAKADFENPRQVYATILKNSPSIVINAAAFTNVDKAETDFDTANTINSTTPEMIAKACREIGAVFIHYSTDYVFADKTKMAPYTHLDKPEKLPENAYGKTKLFGEKKIEKSKCNYIILRTSWVFSSRRKNFVKTILQLAEKNQNLKVINDQTGRPTSAQCIAYQTLEMIEKNNRKELIQKKGTYHITNSGPFCSWFDFAREIFAIKGLNPARIQAIGSEDFHSNTKRPSNSRLDNQHFYKTFGTAVPDFWSDDLRKAVKELEL